MDLPANINNPFFAYGLFKPWQLCFYRIKDFVAKAIDGTVSGILKQRDGKPVSAGVYLYQIRAGEFVQTRKMVLLK